MNLGNRRLSLRNSLLILSFLVVSCGSSHKLQDTNTDRLLAKLAPQAERDSLATEVDEIDENALWRGSLTFQPFVEFPATYVVLTGVESKLTRDTRLSQAVVVCDTAHENRLYLLFIDYDENTQQTAIVFKAPLQVESRSSLSIKAEDLIGDGQKEILIQGFNGQEESVLEIFKHFDNSKGELSLIFSQVLKGTINVLAHERSSSYEKGNWKQESFAIHVCYETLLPNGIVREYQELHQYSPTLGRYCLVKREESQQNINQQFLHYLKSGKRGVMDLLSGPWYKKELKGQGASLFFFDDKKERLQFYNRGRQEVFLWEYSSLPTLQTFYVVAHNDLVEMIRNSFRIRLIDMNTIEISSDADETMELSGVFKRMSNCVQEAVATNSNALISTGEGAKVLSYPEGLFAGSKDVRVEFRYPRLIWREGEKTKEGIFDIFYFKGYQVLQWQFKEDYDNSASQSFVLEYQENEQNPKGKASLVLKPISLLYNRIYFEEASPSLQFDPFSSHF